MSVDYENRERLFNAGIEMCFTELGSLLAVEAEAILKAVVGAYKQDLQALDAKTRILDDIIAIANIGDADTAPEDKYRKIRQVLVGKELIND